MTQLTTKITSATVYPDRALLPRCGMLSLETGTHSLEITEHPYISTLFLCAPLPMGWLVTAS